MRNRYTARKVRKTYIREFYTPATHKGRTVYKKIFTVQVDIGDRIVNVARGFPLPGEVVIFDKKENLAYQLRSRNWQNFIWSCRRFLQIS